jgi:hypothetical protein
VVELHAEGLQVQVLLVAQVGHRELADAVQIVRVAAGGELRGRRHVTVLPARKSAAMSAM